MKNNKPTPNHETTAQIFFALISSIFYLTVFMSTICLTNAASTSEPILDIPHLETVRSDGPPEDLQGRGFSIERFVSDTVTPPDAAASHTSARLAWDDAGLLFDITVRDTTPVEARYASAGYTRDSVEIFLAPDPTRYEYLQAVISPGRDASRGDKPRIYFFDVRSETQKPVPATCDFSVRTNAGGYTVIARLPWACLGIKPSDGLVIGTRIYVNDYDGIAKHRFSWEPNGQLFHPVRLAATASSPLRSAAWSALDLATLTGRVNLTGPNEWAGKQFSVSQAGIALGEITLKPDAAGSAGSLSFEFSALSTNAAASFQIITSEGLTLEVPNRLDAGLKSVFANANGSWESTANDRREAAFAVGAFSQYVFAGNEFPEFTFGDARRLRILLGTDPQVNLTWFDAEGQPVQRVTNPGLYGCLVKIILSSGQSILQTRTLFALPDGAERVAYDDEQQAQILAFHLMGADATRGNATRAANRWWHQTLQRAGKIAPYPYQVRDPASYQADATRKFPLLVYLHGSGYGRPGADKEFFEQFIKPRSETEAVVAYPSSQGGWSPALIEDMIDEIIKNHRVDESRIYLVGFSMGAIGGWQVLLDRPDRFAAAAIIAGGSGAPEDAGRLRGLPIRVINGDIDPTLTKEEAQFMVEALRRVGAPVELVLLPGVAHGDSMFRALEDPGLYAWLASNRRDSSIMKIK